MSSPHTPPSVPRRALIAGVAGLGAVAACAPAADPSPAPTQPTVGAGLQPVPTVRAPTPVAGVDEIPVGGGRVFPERRVVVTQPTAGEFRGFGIVCTHDGCELYYLFSGERDYFIRDRTYRVTRGSFVFIEKNELHRTVDTGVPNHERAVFNFAESLLAPLETWLQSAVP